MVTTNASDVQLLLNDGHGGLTPGGDYLAGPVPLLAAAKDLNADGKMDFVVVNAAGASVFINTPR